MSSATKAELAGILSSYGIYDTSTITGFYPPGAGSGAAGNLFNSENGNPLMSGSVTLAYWVVGHATMTTGPTMVYVSFFTAPNPTAMTAFNVAAVPRTCPVFTWTGFYLTAPVAVTPLGVIGGIYTGFSAMQALDSGTTRGQGFHGVFATWLTGYWTYLPGQNALFRIGGDLLIPIELMDFSIE